MPVLTQKVWLMLLGNRANRLHEVPRKKYQERRKWGCTDCAVSFLVIKYLAKSC